MRIKTIILQAFSQKLLITQQFYYEKEIVTTFFIQETPS
ncbi:surface antigen -like protein [Thermoanaerobacterium thermosaccharolyticum]|uniref:Surface antigen-like protein n=1 Tax=Thermoanaerobacterium thermosaccharolyticum TaxID=1517 RepID=A0A223HXY5_THETR|nr:surface antigen -like protein [Thermoanaerobacterium thermosaccharolyticum]